MQAFIFEEVSFSSRSALCFGTRLAKHMFSLMKEK